LRLLALLGVPPSAWEGSAADESICARFYERRRREQPASSHTETLGFNLVSRLLRDLRPKARRRRIQDSSRIADVSCDRPVAFVNTVMIRLKETQDPQRHRFKGCDGSEIQQIIAACLLEAVEKRL
jgi:hypothetical protein